MTWVTRDCFGLYVSAYQGSLTRPFKERSCSVVECLTQDRGVAGLSLTGVTASCPLARHFYPCLELVQPRQICPDITEKLLTET